MPKIFGKNFSKEELLARVGSISQIGGVRRIVYNEGMEKGVEAIEFRTGTGFIFHVLPDRGMDIGLAEFCGKSLCWHSSTGVVAPEFYEPEGLGWLRSFYGGLLVTCGLTYMGAPCEDEGEELGLHGRASNLRAYAVYADGAWDGDEYIMWAQGKIRQTRVFGENVVLERKISARIGDNKLWLVDCVRNEGAEPTPHMILYHINGGFPAVDGGTELLSPTKEAIPRDADAEVEKEKFAQFLPPTKGFRERCYYHEMVEDSNGFVYAALVNKQLGFGFYVKYKKEQLPKFTEWKMNGWGTYVVGVEPGNAWVEGRAKERERGTLQILQPGEERIYELEIGVLASQEEIAIIEDKVKNSLKEG